MFCSGIHLRQDICLQLLDCPGYPLVVPHTAMTAAVIAIVTQPPS